MNDTEKKQFWNAWRRSICPVLDEITATDRAADGAGPVRIVFDFELDAPCDAGFVGLASEFFAVSLRHVPGFIAGEPGPTMIIHTASIEMELRSEEHQVFRANSIAAHELAHFFDHPTLRGVVPQFSSDQFMADLVLPGLAEVSGNDLENYAKRGIDYGRFVRRSLHIAYRLTQRGIRAPEIYLHDWWASEAWKTFEKLLPEMQSLAHLSIREVDQIEPPAEFAALYQTPKPDEPANVAAVA